MSASKFGVGGDGQVPGTGGGPLPVLPTGHGLGEALLSLLVRVEQGPIGGGQGLVSVGAVSVAGLAGGRAFSRGAGGVQRQRRRPRAGPAAAPFRRAAVPRRSQRRSCRGAATADRRPWRGRRGRRPCRGWRTPHTSRPAGQVFNGWVQADRVVRMAVAVNFAVPGDRGWFRRRQMRGGSGGRGYAERWDGRRAQSGRRPNG